jgi:hypothetical protein
MTRVVFVGLSFSEGLKKGLSNSLVNVIGELSGTYKLGKVE